MARRDFTGIIMVGPDGLTGTKHVTTVRPTSLLQARNITLENGTVEKITGTTLYTPTTLGSGRTIRAGYDWWATATGQRSIIVTSFTSGARISKDSAGAGTYATSLTTLGTTIPYPNMPVFVPGGKELEANARKLFVFTGVAPVKVISADVNAAPTLASGPADWAGAAQPTTGVIQNGRLWGFKGHRGYYSTLTNHESFTATGGGGSIAIYPGEGEYILAATVLGPLIVVWKWPSGIYLIDTSDPTAANWTVRRVTAHLGIASPRAHAIVDGDVIFIDGSAEIHALSAVSELLDVRPRSLSADMMLSPWIRDNVALSQIRKAQIVYFPYKRQIHIALARSDGTINNMRIIADMNLGAPRITYSDAVTCESLWLRARAVDGVPSPAAGDAFGYIRLLDSETRSVDSAGYEGLFQTPHLDVGQLTGDPAMAGRRINGAELEVVFDPQAAYSRLVVDVYWDDALRIANLTYDMGSGPAGSTLGTIIIGLGILHQDQIVQRRHRLTGGGRRISLIGKNSTAGQSFSVSKFILRGTLGDERL